jgi:hypothetical protein
MYLDNKYTRTYYSIINRGIQRNFKTKKEAKEVMGYVERHHIIPRSIGGSDNKSNLVFLTAREHFICHLLLIKMVQEINLPSMIFAIQNFRNRKKNKSKDYKIGSRTYEMIKKLASDEMSKLLKGRTPWNKGIAQSKESNIKRSAALKGKKHTQEHRRKNAEARIGVKRQYSPEGMKNIIRAANLRKGKPLSKEAVQNRLGNVWWNNGLSETRSKISPGTDYFRGRLVKSN